MRRFLLATLLTVVLLALLSPLFPSKAMASPRATSATITVNGTQSWTDTGIDLSSGNSVIIVASGLVYMSPGSQGQTPDGDTSCTADSSFIVPGLHCWSMIGNIANGTPFQLGSNVSFSASASGRLYLGVNDNNFPDNSGSWTANVTVTSSTPKNNVDGNWGGYQITTKTSPQPSDIIALTGNWNVPAISCTNQGKPFSGQMAVWIGFGGIDTHLVQIGTAGLCKNGKPDYEAFIEFTADPSMQKAPYNVPLYFNKTGPWTGKYPISSGDTIHADITHQGYGQYVLRLNDPTQHWPTMFTYINILKFSDYTADTAEWIVENSAAGIFPKFYDAYLYGCTYSVNSNSFTPFIAGSNLQRNIIGTCNKIQNGGCSLWGKPYKATILDPFPDGESFSVYWNNF